LLNGLQSIAVPPCGILGQPPIDGIEEYFTVREIQDGANSAQGWRAVAPIVRFLPGWVCNIRVAIHESEEDDFRGEFA